MYLHVPLGCNSLVKQQPESTGPFSASACLSQQSSDLDWVPVMAKQTNLQELNPKRTQTCWCCVAWMGVKGSVPKFVLEDVPDPSSHRGRTSVYKEILGGGVVFWVYLGFFCVSIFNFNLIWFLLIPWLTPFSSLSLPSCFGKYYIAFFAIILIEICSEQHFLPLLFSLTKNTQILICWVRKWLLDS